MRNILYIIIFVEAFVVTLFAAPPVMRLAFRLGIVDKPGARKVHRTPKPLLGGVAIFAAFFLVVVGNLVGFHLLMGTTWVRQHLSFMVRVAPLLYTVLPRLGLVLAGAFAIHLLGLVDDAFKDVISYKVKFIIQILIATGLALAGIRTAFMPLEALDVLVTIIWIVGISNSFNLLDNLDGLTAGVSLISALLLFGIAVLQGQIFFAFMLIALAGACAGFLIHNFHPAKLFMGDSGSLFLGYIFGVLTVMGSYVVETSASLLPVVLPILILSVPLYDTFSVMFIRWREKRPLFLGDKSHFSHRLLALGMSHRQAVIFIYLVSFCVGIAATLLPYVSLAGSIVILIQAAIIYLLITSLILIGKRNQA